MRYKHLLDTKIGDYHAMVPMVEVDTIGAGGGSIAYVDAGGQFQVGPKSAGADPGPCCYGKGGTQPTATDCQLVLGRLDPNGLLGGRMPLDVSLARDAVARHLAQPLEMDIDEAALAAVRILTHSMVQAIEVNSVRKGYDPRDFALVAFGGAGPLFGFDIARELSIPVVIVPPAPGLTSALGLLTSNVSYDFSITLLQNLDRADLPRVAQTLLDLEARAIAQLTRDGIDPANMTLLRHADCRYVGQGYELRTECPAKVDGDGFVTVLKQAFHAVHQREYGRHFSEKEVELVNLRVVGVGRIPELQPKLAAPGTEALEPQAHLGTRRVVFESGGKAVAHQAAIIQRDALKAGNLITGPAIVQQMDTTTVIPPGFSAKVDSVGNLIIRL
jgi:N-methylhydantoinase A/oxoprolinase/acetone carboxylase beta subunit